MSSPSRPIKNRTNYGNCFNSSKTGSNKKTGSNLRNELNRGSESEFALKSKNVTKQFEAVKRQSIKNRKELSLLYAENEANGTNECSQEYPSSEKVLWLKTS